MKLPALLLLLVAATTAPARATQLQPLQVLPCNATDADMHWLLDAGAGRFKASVALKHAGGGSAECAECSATSGFAPCVAGPCGSSPSLYFTRTTTVGGNFTLTRTGGKLCLTATTGGIGSPVALRDCSAALHGNAAWHYVAATKLLHNNAVQFSQKFDLCLTAPDSAPTKPPVVIASLRVDAAKTTPLPHFWSACVGSSHGKMWVRADWQQHLAMAKELGGFSQVRGHGILDEDVQAYSTGQTFYNAIFAYKFLLSIGMTPLVELSFVPNPIANGTQTCFHYAGACSPPTDDNMDKYGDYVFAFVSALVEYFGVEEVAKWSKCSRSLCAFFRRLRKKRAAQSLRSSTSRTWTARWAARRCTTASPRTGKPRTASTSRCFARRRWRSSASTSGCWSAGRLPPAAAGSSRSPSSRRRPRHPSTS